MSYSTHISTALTAPAPASKRPLAYGLRPWQVLFGLVIVSALASCNDGYNYSCSNCVVTPTEVSLGVVTGNFNGNGFTSVVALSALEPEPAVGSANLKVYLSTGAGAFAAPVLFADGIGPLYLASAALNGDGRRGGGSGTGEKRLVEERAGGMQGEAWNQDAAGDLLEFGAGRG